MANRVLRDWTTSEVMETLSAEAEVFFTRLIMKADDYGTFYANPKLVKAALFPLKEVRDADVLKWISELKKAGLIFSYSAEGKDFIRINKFDQRLRNMRNAFPHPPAHNSQQVAADRGESRPETKRNETETEPKMKPYILNPDDYYTSGQQAFENIKQDDLLIEQLTRIVHNAGYKSCSQLSIALAVRNFITIEEAKPEFKVRPRTAIKTHLVNWINQNASKVAQYATERV